MKNKNKKSSCFTIYKIITFNTCTILFYKKRQIFFKILYPHMARMHCTSKGKSASMKPFTTTIPTFMIKSISEIKKDIIQMANKGTKAAMIGNILRDQYGVGNVSDILGGKTLIEFLKDSGVNLGIPEDLDALVSRANMLRQHISLNKNDIAAKHRLILITSRLHRLARYHREKKNIPGNWKPVLYRN